MCISTLKLDDLENLRKRKYQTLSRSFTYTYFFEPILSKCARCIPTWLSPNIFNIFSIIFAIFPFIYLTYNEANNDFDWILKPFTVKVVALCHFAYLITSNLYLVQVDQTRSTSPYVMLFGNWTNVNNAIFLSYTLSHILLLGNDGPYSTMVFVSMFLTYFSSVYEEFTFGDLHSGYFNLSNEVVLGMFAMDLLAVMFDIKIFATEIWILSLGDWIALCIIIGGVHCTIMSWLNIFLTFGAKKLITGAIDWICFYNVIIVPAVLSEIDFHFFRWYFWLILLTSGLLFARQLADMQVKIFTKQPLSFGIAVIIINLVLPVTFFFREEKFLLLIFTLSSVWLGIELAVIILVRSIEILTFLNGNFLFNKTI